MVQTYMNIKRPVMFLTLKRRNQYIYHYIIIQGVVTAGYNFMLSKTVLSKKLDILTPFIK